MRRSLGWPITLGVVMILLVVALIVGWVVFTIGYWAALAVGTVLLLLVLAGVVLYLTISIKEIRLNQRQANFIDSVTHELKSPIASLKLYLQTLDRRAVTEEQRNHFYRFMLGDVERLDLLINHLLDAARLEQTSATGQLDMDEVAIVPLLETCAAAARTRYRLGEDAIRLNVVPAAVRARAMDVEIIFRNLVDNAVKYGGEPSVVEIESTFSGPDTLIVRVIDNGRGVPPALRRKIFGRFVRLGSELERKKVGTGLGLFIVRQLVQRLRGKIVVRDRSRQSGAIFEVQLPAVRGAAESVADKPALKTAGRESVGKSNFPPAASPKS